MSRVTKATAGLLCSFVDAKSSLRGALPATVCDSREVLRLAREERANGCYAKPRETLETAIRGGSWTRGALWWELVSLMTVPEHYDTIRQLWLDSPEQCRANLSLLRAVARAACMAGEHDECRVLLRRAILLASSRKRSRLKLRARGRRLAKRLLAANSAKFSGPSSAPFDECAAHALRDLDAATQELGVRTFLISGTLLGFVRDNAIIQWDKDIDLGVMTEECPDDIEAFFNAQSSFNVRRVDLSSDRLRINHENGVWIDLFPHYLAGGLRWHDGTATRWWNTPFELERIEFLGVDHYIPEAPERYLDENYGDWRTPDPYFDARIDAPNAEVTDQDQFDSLLYFSLFNAVVKGKERMRERYVEYLRNLGEGEWLNRI